MKIMYLDCYGGIAGDMFLGALIGAGADPEHIKKGLESLDISGYDINIQEGKTHGISAYQVEIKVDEEQQPHRHLRDIIDLINTANLSDKVKILAHKVFNRIAQAEAKVHGTTVSDIHFHEVGAIDSICDIVGCLLAVESLKVDRIFCSPLRLGHGSVLCAHGQIPVPAPATLEILKGVPIRQTNVEGELVTPTGAALAVTLAEQFSSLPSMVLETIGYGMGTRRYAFPNVVRVVLGEAVSEEHKDKDQDQYEHKHEHRHEHNDEHKHEHSHEAKQEHKHENKKVQHEHKQGNKQKIENIPKSLSHSHG